MNRWNLIRLVTVIIVQSSMIIVPIYHSTIIESNYSTIQGINRNSLLRINQENASVDTTPPIISKPVDITILVNTTNQNISWYIADMNPRNYSITHNYQQIESERNKTWSENQSVSYTLDNLMIGIHLFTIIVEDTSNNSAMDDVVVIVREVAFTPTFENPGDDQSNLLDPSTVFFIIILSILIAISVFLRANRSRKTDTIYANLPPENPLDLETWEE